VLSAVLRDVGTIAEAILTLFDVVSFLFLCIVYYLVFVGNAISLKHWRHMKHTLAVLIANPAVAIVSIAPAHLLAIQRDILASLLALAAGIVVYCIFYFWLFRPLIRSADSRIQNTVMMWGVMAALTISSLLFLYLGRDLNVQPFKVLDYLSEPSEVLADIVQLRQGFGEFLFFDDAFCRLLDLLIDGGGQFVDGIGGGAEIRCRDVLRADPQDDVAGQPAAAPVTHPRYPR